MEYVLPTAMHRRITLLNLLHTVNNWRTIDELAEKTAASKKTIVSDLQYIEERWPEVITFEYQHSNEVRLLEFYNHSVHDIYTEILRESNAFALLEAIFFDLDQPGEYWEKYFFLSNSSLYRLAQKLDKSLKKRGMSLNRTPFRIEGEDEQQIRVFFRGYFIEAYSIHDWPFPFDRKLIFSLVKRLNDELNLNFNDYQMVDFAFGMAVTIVRESQGYLLEHELPEEHREVLDVISKYRPQLEAIVAPLDVVLPENWYTDFACSLFWWKFSWNNPQEKMRITELGNQFVGTVVEALGVTMDPISHEKIVANFLDIYLNHMMYPYPRYIIYNRRWYASVVIQQQMVVFSKIVAKALRKLEDKHIIPWYSLYYDEILCDMMNLWEDLPKKMDQIRHQVKIGIFSDLGHDHAKSTALFIERTFGDKVSLIIQDTSYFMQHKRPDPNFDIYVANYTMREVTPDKLFIIEDVPSFKNLTALRRMIEERRLILPKDVPYLRD